MSLRSCFSLAQPTAPHETAQRHASTDLSPAMRLDNHVQLCASCQEALDVPSPQPSCVTRLCGDGFALLAAALTESGRFAAGLAVQVAS